MNSLERKKLIEQTGFKIKNNEIIDLKTQEQLTKTEHDNISKRYISKTSEIYIKGINKITIKRNSTTIELNDTQEEQIITLQDKNTLIKIITTLEGMMYKVGSIKIIETINDKKTEKEYTQRIEQTEINDKVLPLETNPHLIVQLLTQNIKSKKIEILKPLIEENIKKILNTLNQNINKYIKGLEVEKEQEKIKKLKQFQRL